MNEDILNNHIEGSVRPLSFQNDFFEFLSFEEAVSTFNNLLNNFRYLSEISLTDSQEEELENNAELLDKLAKRIVKYLQSTEKLDKNKKSEIVRAFNEQTIQPHKSINKQKNFQHLRFMLTSLKNYPSKNSEIINSTPSEIFDLLLQAHDDVLSVHGVHFYKTKYIDKKSLENSRLHLAHVFLNGVRQNEMSDFKREFLVEWIFESALLNAILFDELVYVFVTFLKDTVKIFGNDAPVMHGLLKALQKDYITLNKSIIQNERNFNVEMLDKAVALIETLFPILVSLTKENLSFVSKNIIGFAFDLSIPKEEYRIFKWNQWRWIRMLATGIWDASLREPPSWVVSGGSQYCAIIFDAAPPVWLKDYAYTMVERVYAETLVQGFIPTLQHYDYVEFLVRSLKKKSPYFGSHHDSYLTLHLLSRLNSKEIIKESTLKLEDVPEGPNPVSRSLAVFLRMIKT